MNWSSKYHKSQRTFQPQIHRGRIIELQPNKGYGKIESTIQGEVILNSSSADLNRLTIGETVSFQVRPFHSCYNRYHAFNVFKTYRSKDGFLVTDRPESHIHGDLKKRLQFIVGKIDCDDRQYFHHVVTLPILIGEMNCVKVTWKDEIVYALREDRNTHAKYVKNRKPESTKYVTIILMKTQDVYIIISCFYGDMPEYDPYCHYDRSKKDNTFWEDHALIYGSEPISRGSETTTNPWTGIDEGNTFAEILRRR